MKRMSSVLALVLAVVLILSAVPFGASADTTAVTNVTYTVKDDIIYFQVTTGEGYNRVKLMKADALGTSLAVGSTGVDNGDGTFTWTVKYAQPDAQTEFAFDARRASDGKYTKTYYKATFVPVVEKHAISSVEHSVESGIVYFSVVTGTGYDRVKVALASAPSKALAVGTKAVDNGDGTVTWTVKLDEPSAQTAYVFDARSAETLKYEKDYFDYTYTPVAKPVSPIKSVESFIDAGMLCFNVVTGAGYSRIKLSLASAPSTSVAVGNTATDNGDGTYTWLVKVTNPEKAENYLFDARDAETAKYTKNTFEYAYVPSQEVAMFQSVSAQIAGDKVVFTIITDDIFNRVKVASVDNPTGYIKYSDKYVDLGDGRYQWEISFTAPESETQYLLDGRYISTNKYARENYAYTLKIEDQPAIKSVNAEIIGEKVFFTIITDGVFNRVKIASADDPNGYIKYTNTYTDLGDGKYQWEISFTAPESETQYLVDGRFTSTNKYARENFAYTLVIKEQAVIKSAEVNEVDGKAVFTVVTSNKYNRVKISYANELSSYITYTNNFTELANSDRQWVITIDMPKETTEYSLDARLIATSKYTKEYYNCTVTVEKPIVSPYVDIKLASGAYYATVTLTTTDGCNNAVVSYSSNGEVKRVDVSSYTVDADGNRVFTCSVSLPATNTVFTAEMYDEDARLLDTAEVIYYAGSIDHEIIS